MDNQNDGLNSVKIVDEKVNKLAIGGFFLSLLFPLVAVCGYFLAIMEIPDEIGFLLVPLVLGIILPGQVLSLIICIFSLKNYKKRMSFFAIIGIVINISLVLTIIFPAIFEMVFP